MNDVFDTVSRTYRAARMLAVSCGPSNWARPRARGDQRRRPALSRQYRQGRANRRRARQAPARIGERSVAFQRRKTAARGARRRLVSLDAGFELGDVERRGPDVAALAVAEPEEMSLLMPIVRQVFAQAQEPRRRSREARQADETRCGKSHQPPARLSGRSRSRPANRPSPGIGLQAGLFHNHSQSASALRQWQTAKEEGTFQ